ncbi:MAG: hypothetical protein N3C60_09735 [Calditerrivibrio sp.]|nr:hypothetical protein [Calditerrivibrio sp.]
MTGKMALKSGDQKYPGLIETFFCCLSLIFFSEKALFRIYVDDRLKFNLVTIFLFTLLIPYKSLDSELLYDFDKIVYGVFLTLFYLLFLYILMPRRSIPFLKFLKLFVAIEVMNIFAPISFLFDKDTVLYFGAIMVSWYLAVSVFIYSKISGLKYFWSCLVVLSSFLISNFLMNIT